jgi:rhodanese-related sulfurtransferase
MFGHKPVPTETPEEISVALMKGEVIIIDVREVTEWTHERIEGASLVPLSRFDAHHMPHPQGRDIVIVSEKGGKRGAAAFEKAVHAGMHPRAQIAGGMVAWKAAGLPVTSGTGVTL